MWKTIVWVLGIVSTTSLLLAITREAVTYENYKLFGIIPETETELELLQKLKNEHVEFSYWKEPSWLHEEMLIMVAPYHLPEFYEIMDMIDAPYKLKINNIQKLIDDTMPKSRSQRFDFKSYHTLEEIYDNLERLAKKYRNKAQVVIGGRTWEGRMIKGVRIINGEKKPGIFIESGMHAREWIAPATVMYILHQLLTSKDSGVRFLADNHNWFIFPILNPDGYVYSHVWNRLWKNTRKPASWYCTGSDLNRNWDFHWNTIGASNDPCNEFYPGSSPFSEVETKSISEYMRSNVDNFDAYISFHSFGQKLMFPYAYTDAHISNYDELYRVGSKAGLALGRRYHTHYRIGCVGEIYRDVSGLSVDYVAGVLRKSFVYAYELRDNSEYYFLLPPEQIIPTGREIFDSLIALFNETLSHEYAKNV